MLEREITKSRHEDAKSKTSEAQYNTITQARRKKNKKKTEI